MKFSKKNGAVQVMALLCIAAILIPAIFMAFAFGLVWLFLLMALIFVPVLFIERRLDNA